MALYDLERRLGDNFPEYSFGNTGPELEIISQTPLSNEQIDLVKNEIKKMGMTVRSLVFTIKNSIPIVHKHELQDAMHQSRSRSQKHRLSKNLYSAYSADLNFWEENRRKITTDSVENLISLQEKTERSKCIIDLSVFPHSNIRNHLSIYDEIFLCPPLTESNDELLARMSVTNDEIVYLAEKGKLNLVMTQNLNRYHPVLIERVFEANPNAIIFSKKLIAVSVLEARKRLYFPYAQTEINEKIEFLRLFQNLSNHPNNDIAKICSAFLKAIKHNWSRSLDSLNSQTPIRANSSGLGVLASELLQAQTGKNFDIEMFSISPVIEWAAGLKATVVPPVIEDEDFYEINCGFLASLYTAIPATQSLGYSGRQNHFVENVLAVDGNIPISEFISAMQEADMQRFRKIINNAARNTQTLEEITENINTFNKQIQSFEKRRDFLQTYGISGLLFDLPLDAIDPNLGQVIPKYLPISLWIFNTILALIEKNSAGKDVFSSSIIDSLRAISTASPPDAVLVSRLKKRLGS